MAEFDPVWLLWEIAILGWQQRPVACIYLCGMGMGGRMSRSKTILLDEVLKNPLAFFAAAKSNGAQHVEDEDGTFTLEYHERDSKPDAREYLARGGRSD